MQEGDTEGPVTFSITPTDLVGNIGDSVTATDYSSAVTFDKAAPAVAITAPAADSRVKGSTVITFTNGEGTSECSVNNETWVACTSGETTLGDVTGFNALEDGSFILHVSDTDAAGNEGATSTPLTKDTAAPSVVSHTPVLNALNVSPTAPIVITFSEPVTVESGDVSFSPSFTAFDISSSGNDVTLTPTSAMGNNTTYTVTLDGVTDLAGNALPTYSGINFTTATSFSIPLHADKGGWNLVSLPTVPSSTTVADVLGSASPSIAAVWTYDPKNVNANSSNNGWFVYYPGDAVHSNLTDMTAGYGYWVSVTGGATLAGSGTLFTAQQTPPSRNLTSGWNLVGYYQIPGEDSSTIANAFSAVGLAGVDYTALWGFDNTTGAFINVNTILPGDAFWMSVPKSDKVYTPSNLNSAT